jgi:hypothetical protein
MSDDEVIQAINQCGWRQGKLFRLADHHRLLGKLAPKIDDIPDDTGRFIVVSQSCDIVSTSLVNEPYVEVLAGQLLTGTPDGNYTRCKNPRILHFPITIEGAERYLECRSARRAFLSRTSLSDCVPDPAAELSPDALAQIQGWLAGRYMRTAFPGVFNDRIDTAKRALRKALERDGQCVDRIYVNLTPWTEIGDDSPYELSIFFTMREEDYKAAQKLLAVNEVRKKFIHAINNCDGIMTDIVEVSSRATMTLEDVAMLQQWSIWDDLSVS